MTKKPKCNRCDQRSVLAGEWGVCRDCFVEDMKRFNEMLLDDDQEE